MSLLEDSQEQEYQEDEFAEDMRKECYQYGEYEEELPPVAVHQCNVCNKIFMSYKGLQQHSVIHTDTKPYICDVCGRGFRFKSNMFEHRTVHTGYTPHLCPFCGKQFRLKGNMKKHMRVHVTTKEELEAAYRPYSSNRRSSSAVPDNALVIRGSPMPFFGNEKRRGAAKLQLGKDASRWVNMICQNELLPSTPFNEKVVRANMRLMGDQTYDTMFEMAKSLEFEIFWCPVCKCECSGREECDLHLYTVHGKKLEDMDEEPNYCGKCMRIFCNENMFLQHQSYHSRVQLMMRNREIDYTIPDIGLSEICYNLLSNRDSVPSDSDNLPRAVVYPEEDALRISMKNSYARVTPDANLNNPGNISLVSDNLDESASDNVFSSVTIKPE